MWHRYKRFYNHNELFIKIFSIALTAILIVAFTIGFVAIKAAEKAYLASYKESNELLLDKVTEDYEALNDNIVTIFQTLSFNPAMKHFLKDNLPSELDNNVAIYQMKEELQNTRLLYNKIASHLILVGKNEKIHFQGQGRLLMTSRQLLASDYLKKAEKIPQSLHYTFSQHGYTDITKDKPNLIISKALYDEKGIYGFAVMMILEEEFSQFYTELVDPSMNHLWITNAAGQIISSNLKEDIGKTNRIFLNNIKSPSSKIQQTISKQPIYSFDYTLYNAINDKLVAKRMVLLPIVFWVSLVSILSVSIMTYLVIRKTTSPIYELTEKIPAVINGDFSKSIAVRGTHEIQELLNTYNFMLAGLHDYVNQVLEKEQEKSLLSLKTLQLQIQPHFIYNTLTAIKFQIMSGDYEGAINAQDAFIKLLQNIISIDDDLIPLHNELENLKNYLLILNVRYGEKVTVAFHQTLTNENYLVPKLFLQPFLENAFIHAFPEISPFGRIDVFITETEDSLHFEIIDNGTGFQTGQSETMTSQQKKAHFSGIGITNIDERLKLLFPNRHNLSISSTIGSGTVVSIQLPKIAITPLS